MRQDFGTFEEMDKALQLYVRHFALTSGVLKAPPQFDDKGYRSRALTPAETGAELAGFHLWTHDLAGARALAEQALKDDPISA